MGVNIIVICLWSKHASRVTTSQSLVTSQTTNTKFTTTLLAQLTELVDWNSSRVRNDSTSTVANLRLRSCTLVELQTKQNLGGHGPIISAPKSVLGFWYIFPFGTKALQKATGVENCGQILHVFTSCKIRRGVGKMSGKFYKFITGVIWPNLSCTFDGALLGRLGVKKSNNKT